MDRAAGSGEGVGVKTKVLFIDHPGERLTKKNIVPFMKAMARKMKKMPKPEPLGWVPIPKSWIETTVKGKGGK